MEKDTLIKDPIIFVQRWFPLFAMVLFATPILAQTSYKFDFGISSVPAVSGYTKVQPTNKYTWSYANDNTVGNFGFENWDSTAWGGVDRGGSSNPVNRDYIYSKPRPNGFTSFYFSVHVPEGNYTVTFYIGDPSDTSTTTIKAESRRLLVHNLHTTAGQVVTRTFTVLRREPAIAGGGEVNLDEAYGREVPAICLNWDHKLTFEFSGARPCIGGLDIVKVDTGITLHLCGNSTLVEQEDEPWASYGQFLPNFFNASIMTNDLATSGISAPGFLSEGRLKKICSVMKPGDYLLVEFGHNEDQTGTTWENTLQIFADSAIKHSATPVFVTPTSRLGDATPADFVGGYAVAMKNYATKKGYKCVDLNQATIDMKTAHATAAYGGVKTAIYSYFDPSPLWPDQAKASDGTHFCDFGGYELAKWIAQTGLKAAGIDLSKYLRDTAAFDPKKPDLKNAFNFPFSLDTIYRHTTKGPTIYSDIVSLGSGLNATMYSRSLLSVKPATALVKYRAPATGKALFSISSFSGKVLAKKQVTVSSASGSFEWMALRELPAGTYFLQMRVNGQTGWKTRFCVM